LVKGILIRKKDFKRRRYKAIYVLIPISVLSRGVDWRVVVYGCNGDIARLAQRRKRE